MKKCVKCGETKVVDAFGRDSSRPDGRYSYCKQCRRNPNRKELEVIELAQRGLKKCSLCLKVKPFCAFEKDSSKSLGVTSRCKKCKREARRMAAASWHQTKSELRQLYEDNKMLCSICNEVKDISLFLKDARRGFGVNRTCFDCNNKTRRQYYFHRKKSSRDYTNWEVFEDDEFTCYICEDVLDPLLRHPHPKSLSIDHVFPLARGGLDCRDNVRTACLDCNRRKNDLTIEEYMMRLDL